jgi:hypothetical protein
MTNRARPTWPEGAADSSKSQRPSQGGKQSSGPATPASNGRSSAVPSGNGQPRPGAPNGQRPSEFRPQPRPATTGGPGQAGAAPVRPQQQPGPSTPGRPEPWSPTQTPAPPATSAPSASSYGLTGKTESFGDRVSAARQAVLDKAAAVKADKADKTESRVATKSHREPRTSNRPQTRKARLRMSRIDPWSVMKTAFLLSIAFGIVTWVAVFIIWSAIGAAGVFDNINSTVQEVLGTPTAEPFRIENYINTGKVMGFTTLLACADVLIITALATLGSFLYNIAATLLGGLEVTLASED